MKNKRNIHQNQITLQKLLNKQTNNQATHEDKIIIQRYIAIKKLKLDKLNFDDLDIDLGDDEFTNEDSELNEVFKSPLDSRSVNNNSRNLDYNNKYFIDNNIDPLLNKHKQSNIQYNQVVYDNQYNSYQKHQPSLDNITTELSSYQKKINKSIDDYNSDRYYNNNVLNNNPCKEEQQLQLYSPELRDVNIENYVKHGYPTSKNKSIGR